jgi:aspartyl-tRNA(Asn)/glutamyl-tRNA(Gln) amidotransferase subunit B
VRIEIERVHLEEDTGKSLHVGGSTGRIHGATHSLVDYNRAGIPLVEIVTKPVTGTGHRRPRSPRPTSPSCATCCAGSGVSDVRMEQGSLRCDVNVSLNRPGQPWGTRSETKNVNSLRSVERAVRSEVERQAACLRDGGGSCRRPALPRGTPGCRRPGRSKEEATDYRYFPEPDLVPVAPDPAWSRAARRLPEAPTGAAQAAHRRAGPVRARRAGDGQRRRARRRARHRRGRCAGRRGAELVARPPRAERQRPRRRGRRAAITPAQVARVVELVGEGSLNAGLARQVVDGVLAGEGGPGRRGGRPRPGRRLRHRRARVPPSTRRWPPTRAIADKVRGGKVQAVGALVGAVMKATRGQADAAVVRGLLLERLGVTEG